MAPTTESETPPLSVVLVSTVSGAANGGTAGYVRALGDHLAANGNQVRGVCRLYKDNARVMAYDEADTDADGKAHAEFAGWQTTLIHPRSAMKPLLKQTVRFLTRPALRNAAIGFFRTAYRDSITQAVPAQTDIVHYTGSGWELMGYAALDAARARKAAFVITPFVHPGSWADSPVDIDLYNQADVVCVCSGYEHDHLIERGVEAKRLRRIGVAPTVTAPGDGERFRARHNLGNRPLVFFLARKQRYKGYHALCEAMQTVARAVPDACLVVAGPDAGEEPYPIVPAHNFLDLGELRINPEDVAHKADALAACDVFCMPSEAEAFGIVYVEAWANKMPVIGGTAPALRELIDEGINGFRVAQEPAEIANRLITLLTDKVLCRKLGQNGWEKQQAQFTWEVISHAHQMLYRQFVTRKSGSPTDALRSRYSEQKAP